MATCLKDFVNMRLSRIDGGFYSLNTAPLAGPDIELDLVLYRIAKLVFIARLDPKLLYALFGTFLQRVRVFTVHFENLSLFTEALPRFKDHSINGGMRFSLHFLSELVDVLVFLGKEVEISLKVGIND